MTVARSGRAVVLAAALLVLVAAPAGAHPFFRDGEVPVDSLATVTLDLAHGCESEDAGAGQDTTEVALQVPDWMRIVDVPEPDGWSVELETAPDDQTQVAVVTWTTADPREPAPVFDLDVVVGGGPGDERHVGVFQACDDVVHRWVGTPDEPADDPAVRLALVEPDPDSPPPAEPGPQAEPDEPVDADADAEPAEPDPSEGGVDEEMAAPADADAPAADAAAATASADDAPWGVIALAAAALAALVAALVARARRAAGGPTRGGRA